MTDVFFSYSSADRERVRPIRDALAAQGFEVFWDQQVPAGMDWDTWIRQHLIKSKCAMAFWSATSVSSDNVRHEAMVAKQQGKLISVLLEPLTAEQFPMGLYAQQAANLSGWSGDYDNDQWRKFRREFEAKLTPLWVRRQIDEIEAELVGERARREGAERRDRVLQAQIAKEAEAQQDLKRERDKALDEVAALGATVEKLTRAGADATAREADAERRDRALQAQIAKSAEAYEDLKRDRDTVLDDVVALKTTVEELTQARADAKAKQAEAQQALTRDRNKALDEVAALKTTVEELTQARADADVRVLDLSQRLRNVRKSKAQETARSISAALPPFVIAAAVATLGFWTYQLIRSAPPPLLAVTSESTPEAEQQRLAAIKEAEQLQGKAADAEAKLQAAEAEQQGLKKEVQRQSTLAADAEAKRKAAEAEQQRLAALLKAEQERREKAEAEAAKAKGATGLFTIKNNTQASGPGAVVGLSGAESRAACEEICTRDPNCKVFTYYKSDGSCYSYARADFTPNEQFDSGLRIEQTNPSADIKVAPPTSSAATQVISSTGLFTIRTNTEVTGTYGAQGTMWGRDSSFQSSRSGVTSATECEKVCTQEPSCKTFSYDKRNGVCYRYTQQHILLAFKSNENFDSGVRIEQPK